MRQSKTKKLRKQIFALNLEPEAANKFYRNVKKATQGKEMQMKLAKLSKKRHTGESYEDFRERRKICNQRRRQRKGLQL